MVTKEAQTGDETINWSRIRVGQIAFVKLAELYHQGNGHHDLGRHLDPYRSTAMVVYSPIKGVPDADNQVPITESLETVRLGKITFDVAVEANIHLALITAKRVFQDYQTPLLLEFGDCYSLATVGLMQAVARFNPYRVRFKTFAIPRMRGSILDEIRRLDPTSRSSRKRQDKIHNTIWAFYRDREVMPDQEQLSELTGLTPKQLQNNQHSVINLVSLAEVTTNNEGYKTDKGTRILIDDDTDLEEIVEKRMQIEAVNSALAHLPKEERLVFQLLSQGLNQRETAEILGFSEPRISILYKQSIEHIRLLLQSE